jgi:glutathione S-transferase
MKLIGMLDSPYVRRVAISLQFLGLRFEHQSLSVFRTFAEFQKINPVVKAPTFVADDGTVLMDSTLILEYAEALARPRTLMPGTPQELCAALRVIGLALAATEKSVQIVYERELRPPEKLHEPWVERVTGQILAAYSELEAELAKGRFSRAGPSLDQAAITTAVAWHFTQQTIPDVVAAPRFPRLVGFSQRAESLPQFRAAPHGDSTFRHDR